MSTERNLVMVRIADPSKEPVKEWLEANSERNEFDPAVLSYPEMRVLAGHSNGTTYNYLPIQLVGMFESIGVNPEATPLQVATGIMECVKAGVVLAQNANLKEVYFLGSDETTEEGAKRMGFESLPYKVFRKRI